MDRMVPLEHPRCLSLSLARYLSLSFARSRSLSRPPVHVHTRTRAKPNTHTRNETWKYGAAATSARENDSPRMNGPTMAASTLWITSLSFCARAWQMHVRELLRCVHGSRAYLRASGSCVQCTHATQDAAWPGQARTQEDLRRAVAQDSVLARRADLSKQSKPFVYRRTASLSMRRHRTFRTPDGVASELLRGLRVGARHHGARACPARGRKCVPERVQQGSPGPGQCTR